MARRNRLFLVLLSILLISYCCYSTQRLFESACKFNKGTGSSSAISNSNVPVLCYHQIRNWNSNDTKSARIYITPIESFKEQMQLIHDSGYQTILPNELIAHLQKGEKIPDKTIMLTFDDGTISQYENALPELNKLGFRAVFFLMTVTLNKNGYLNDRQVKQIADQGHVVGCHTWDHHNVTSYNNADWEIQIGKPKLHLEQITGISIEYFAYPNGLWNNEAVNQLKKYGFKCAFQLYGKIDQQQPLFTVKRILVDGHWNSQQFSDFLHH